MPQPNPVTEDLTELQQFISRLPLDQERVQDVRWFFNTYPMIDGTDVFCRRMSPVLRLADTRWPGLLEQETISWLPSFLDELAIAVKQTNSVGGQQHVAAGGDLLFARRFVWRNPLHALVLRLNVLDEESDVEGVDPEAPLHKIRLLLAHVALATIKIMRVRAGELRKGFLDYTGNEPWDEIKFPAYAACHAVWRVSKLLPWARMMLSKLPVGLPPGAFARKARPEDFLDEKEITDEVWRHGNDLAAYLEGAYGIRRRKRPRTKLTENADFGDPDDPSFEGLEIVLLEDDAPLDPWGEESCGTHQPLTRNGSGGRGKRNPKDEWQQALEWDNCPDEDFEQDEYILWMTGGLPRFDESPESYQAFLQAQRYQTVRDNKWFAFAFSRLLPHELAKIEIDCRRKVERLTSKATMSLQEFRNAEDCMLPLVTLWLGPGRWRSLAIVPEENAALEQEAVLVAAGPDDPAAMFRLKVPFPDYKHVQTPVPDRDRRRDPYVLLPDYAELAPLLFALDRHRANLKDSTTGAPKIFASADREYTSRHKRLLKTLDKSGRITLSKLEQALFGNVMSRTGSDVVAATMISGYPSRISKVPMYYACRSFDNINTIYHRVVSAMRAEIWSS